MRRRLFTVLSAASLVLVSATCVLWVRGALMRDDGLFYWWNIYSIDGSLVHFYLSSGPREFRHSFLGFVYSDSAIGIPYWFTAAVFAILPAGHYLSHDRRIPVGRDGMKQSLFPILSRVSLGLCVIWIALWVVSCQWPWYRSVIFDGPRGPNGGIVNGAERGWDFASSDGSFFFRPHNSDLYWDTPYWKLLVLSLVLPIRRLVRIRKLKAAARRVGHCATCGYDLRATPRRCPECGTVPNAV